MINVSGGVEVMVFDKTGTLTEEGLETSGVVPVNKEGSFDALVTDIS